MINIRSNYSFESNFDLNSGETWLLGVQYQADSASFASFSHHFASQLWFTYRRNFKSLIFNKEESRETKNNNNSTTDAGKKIRQIGI